MRVHGWRLATVAAIVAALGASTVVLDGAGQTQTYVGRLVADVLRELQAKNLRIVFTTEHIPATLRVTVEPKSSDPEGIAREILQPHGLTTQRGPRGSLIVVAAPRAKPTAPAPPVVPSPAGDQPAPATATPEPIYIEERVDVVDRFTDAGHPLTTYAVTPSEVREAAGGLENVFQVLQVLPGVAATNDDEGKLVVRGAGPEHNLIVLDGVQIHTPQRFGHFTASFFNPAVAASVTLDPSGLDAHQGGRLSSVVMLETRDGRRDRKLAASGSLGLTNGDLLFEGRLPGTESGAWWATARGTYYRLVADRFDDGTIPSFNDMQFKLTVNPSKRTRLAIFGLSGREAMRELNRTPAGATETASQLEATHRVAAATLRWTPGPRLIATTTVSGYSSRSHHADEMFIIFTPPFERRVDLVDLAARHRVVYAASRTHAIDAGAEVHRVRSSWQMSSVKQQEWWRGIGPSVWGELVDYTSGPIDSRLTRTQVGLWAQDRIRVGAHLTLEPGLRLDWNSFTAESAWQPRFRATVQAGGTSVWAGLSMQAQTPSHERLQGFDYLDLTESQSERLRNERSLQFVAGIQRDVRKNLSLRVEGYHRQLDRVLVQRLETDEERQARLAQYVLPPDLPSDSVILEHRPTVHPENTGRGTATGIEVLLRRDGQRVSGWLGYTLSKATRDVYGHTMPFDFDRRHALSAALNVQLSRRLRASATWQQASGFPTTPVRDEVLFAQTILLDGTIDPLLRASRQNGRLVERFNPFERRLASVNTERLSGYSRTDVRVTYATGGRWEFYGEIINLFDVRNHRQEFHTGSFDGSTSVYEQFRLLPAFGVRVTF